MFARSAAVVFVFVLGLALAARPGLGQEEWSFEGSELLVTNLAGEVTLRGHDDSRIIVRATPGGRDAEKLVFRAQPDGRAEFHVVYPLGESTKFRYPRGRGGRTKFSIDAFGDESSLARTIYSEVSRRERIEVGPGVRGGLEAYADLEILIPRGVSTRIVLAVGGIKASGVLASIDLDAHTGRVEAENVTGDVRIDTGSGAVRASDVRGSLWVDTGSGAVEVQGVEGDEVLIDTGSGGVRATGVTAQKLEIDTGSGSVRTERISAGSTKIDTGSGSVTLDMVRLDQGEHIIDTGSGSVTIMLPPDASVRIHAETSSGGISLDLPQAARLLKMSRDEVDLEIGNGEATITIDTGSGAVRLQSRGEA